MIAGVEPKIICVLGKYYVTELCPQPHTSVFKGAKHLQSLALQASGTILYGYQGQ